MSLEINELAQCTGFPPEVLLDFADRGLLPRVENEGARQETYDGFALLRNLEEVTRAR